MRTPPYRLSTRHIRKSLNDLAARDGEIRRALRAVGVPDERRRPEGFETLLRVIVGQQISVQAAAAIYARFEAALEGEVSPERLLRRRESTLRRVGLSAPKVRYARCLAQAVKRGEL
ncbi:MAG: DNA-3-methyladenine glycosylase 2 family protein, partial [Myxococcota bacterium]